MDKLILSCEIYPRKAIEYTIEQFVNIAGILLSEENGYHCCLFNVIKDIPKDIVIAEFENYLIDHINSEKMYGTD